MDLYKITDDVIDMINYLIFVYCKLKNCKVGEALWDVYDIYEKRKKQYEDAWRFMDIDELLAGVRLKAGRINAMWSVMCNESS